MDEIYYTFYYMWINPTFWSLLVIFICCGMTGYILNMVTNGLWGIVGLGIIAIFIMGGIIVAGVNVIQVICGIYPRFLSEFDYIITASWFNDIFWGCVGLGVGTFADTCMVIRD